MGLRYRTLQFLRTFWNKPTSADLQIVSAHLPVVLRSLFDRMTPADQAHSIRVCQTLLRQGQDNPDLLIAALLHDVGKSVLQPTVWERVLVVLANQIVPERVFMWSEAEARGLRRAFVIAHKHPEWGADLVAEHGGSNIAVQLIRFHQTQPGSNQPEALSHHLSLLKAADSGN